MDAENHDSTSAKYPLLSVRYSRLMALFDRNHNLSEDEKKEYFRLLNDLVVDLRQASRFTSRLHHFTETALKFLMKEVLLPGLNREANYYQKNAPQGLRFDSQRDCLSAAWFIVRAELLGDPLNIKPKDVVKKFIHGKERGADRHLSLVRRPLRARYRRIKKSFDNNDDSPEMLERVALKSTGQHPQGRGYDPCFRPANEQLIVDALREFEEGLQLFDINCFGFRDSAEAMGTSRDAWVQSLENVAGERIRRGAPVSLPKLREMVDSLPRRSINVFSYLFSSRARKGRVYRRLKDYRKLQDGLTCREQSTEDFENICGSDGEDSANNHVLEQRLQSLKPRQQEVARHLADGQKPAEIARLLGITRAAVSKLMKKIKNNLPRG